jgi:3-hydroxymyristoyl/3-hydroxydecanoyl-(acyl carrier protein) dehydratase
MDLAPCRLSPAQAYDRRILFHGPNLQCIEEINGVSAKGIDVIARCGQKPAAWYADVHAKQWTLDPLMLDAAFQAAILWSYENRGAVCLPNAWESLRVYASYPAYLASGQDRTVRIMFTVNHDGRHKIQGYLTFLDSNDIVIASIMGFEALTDPNLLEKFKSRPLFDRDNILAFAQGNPSEAFGPEYKAFDQDRQIARLPRPPYFFMDRVIRADHPQWQMQSGGWIQAQYDIPPDAWYFKANQTQAMPFSILLEIALQPCGWLAAYAGSALHSDDRLFFRNLGGTATLSRNPVPGSGTVTVRSRMTEVSQAGGMIIQDFDIQVLNNGRMIYQGTTNFGFFTQDALASQVGIRTPRFYTKIAESNQGVVFEASAPITPDDVTHAPASKHGMPATALRMIDRIDFLDFKAGCFDQGLICATKTVNPSEWFFDAHFYQDPVCPGSLGIESFIQLLRYFILQKHQINAHDYDIRMGQPHTHQWVYRGQIIPSNKVIEVQAHIKSCDQTQAGFAVSASGALVVDGICIYEFQDFSLELIAAASPALTRDLAP